MVLRSLCLSLIVIMKYTVVRPMFNKVIWLSVIPEGIANPLISFLRQLIIAAGSTKIFNNLFIDTNVKQPTLQPVLHMS